MATRRTKQTTLRCTSSSPPENKVYYHPALPTHPLTCPFKSSTRFPSLLLCSIFPFQNTPSLSKPQPTDYFRFRTGHGCPIPTGHPGWHCKHNGKGKGKGKGHGKHTTTKAWWDGPNNGLVPTSIAAPSYVPEPTGTGRPHCYSTTVSAWEAEETGAAGGVVRVMREKRT